MSRLDPIEEASVVIDIYDYALTNKLNIDNKDDVKAVLKALGHEVVSDDRLEKLMTALQVTDRRIKIDVEHRRKVN